MNQKFTLPEFETEGTGDRVPPSRSNLLEASKLSRLPSLPKRTAFSFDNSPDTKMAVTAVCAGCGGSLDREDSIQQRFSGCRKCVGIYGRLDAAAEQYDQRKRRKALQKFAEVAR